MKLTSPAFGADQPMPTTYTCQGVHISPPLHIRDVPAGTKSLALIVHDPDAVNGDFVHWLVWNIPPSILEIVEAHSPAGATQGTNDFGVIGYGSPCPPQGSGSHRYIFELYALSTMLRLPETTTREVLTTAMQPYIVSQAQLIGLFGT